MTVLRLCITVVLFGLSLGLGPAKFILTSSGHIKVSIPGENYLYYCEGITIRGVPIFMDFMFH